MIRIYAAYEEAWPLPEGAGLPPFHMPWCFGCGTENEQGLGLEARIEGDKIVSDLQFAPWFAGGPGVVHGGAIGAFFDDLIVFGAEPPDADDERDVIERLRPISRSKPLKR